MARLKCSSEMFHYACERMAYRLAEKNYHLELLTQQVTHR
jgi:hypothetical protein